MLARGGLCYFPHLVKAAPASRSLLTLGSKNLTRVQAGDIRLVRSNGLSSCQTAQALGEIWGFFVPIFARAFFWGGELLLPLLTSVLLYGIDGRRRPLAVAALSSVHWHMLVFGISSRPPPPYATGGEGGRGRRRRGSRRCR